MKVVGKTDKGYLVQITDTEIGICMGLGPYADYGNTKERFRKETGRDDRTHDIPTNVEIAIIPVFNYLTTLKENQIKAKACADTLRQLADLITKSLPEILIPEEKVDAQPPGD